MATILVINPYVIDFKLYDEWMHPVGLYFLITALERNNHTVWYYNCLEQSNTSPARKFSTGLFDSIEIEKPLLFEHINRKYKLYGRPQEELKAYLSSIPRPDIICLGTMMTYWADGVIVTARIIREFFPDTHILLGGIAAQLIPEYFTKNIPDCQTAGVLFTAPDNPAIPFAAPLSTSDSFVPALKHVLRPHGALLLSLGCPLACSYCASRTLQKQFVNRPFDTVRQELDYYVNFLNVKALAFCDDALLVNPEHGLYPLIDYIRDNNIQVTLHTPNGLHLRYATEPLMQRLYDAGFRTLRFGFESSLSKHKSDTCGKIQRDNLTESIRSIKNCGFSGTDIGIYIMAGLNDQTPQDVIDEMEFIGSLDVQVKPVFLSPVPSTPLYKKYLSRFPQLATNPLWHNDTFFITQLPHWDDEAVENVRYTSKVINARHTGSGFRGVLPL
jgi:hypothetical protein